MITKFDDYNIHQTAMPVAQPSQSDRNFYDRYWMNGFDEDASYLFEIGLGLYPNRRVMDAHFSVSLGDRQVCFLGSRRAPKERADMSVGPLSLDILEPMRRLRVHLAPNEHNIECDLEFTAISVPHEEPANVMYDDGHLIMHNSRFTQMGRWNGWFSVDGERVEVKQAFATRDKSWGVRPVGEPQGGAPGLLNNDPGVYWIWNPVNWGEFCTQMGSFEDRDGRPTQVSADRLPLYSNPTDIPEGEDEGLVPMRSVTHELSFISGTRRPERASFEMTSADGDTFAYELEPLRRFHMLGIGYNHFEWGHAYWKGELETGREDFDLTAINPLDYQFLHIHQVVRARSGDRVGYGTLENIIIGRHNPSGFKELFDGAS